MTISKKLIFTGLVLANLFTFNAYAETAKIIIENKSTSNRDLSVAYTEKMSIDGPKNITLKSNDSVTYTANSVGNFGQAIFRAQPSSEFGMILYYDGRALPSDVDIYRLGFSGRVKPTFIPDGRNGIFNRRCFKLTFLEKTIDFKAC